MSNSKFSYENARLTVDVNSVRMKVKKSILVVNTGGTFSSKRKNGGKLF